MEYHVGDPYDQPWCYTRATFYNVTATPTCWFDGDHPCVGAYANVDDQQAWYVSNWQDCATEPTDVTIEMCGEQLVDPNAYEITATVCIDPNGSAKSMRIYMVQALNHWPSSPVYSRNTFKQAALTEDITLNPGECQDIVRTFIFDSDSMANQDEIKIITWAQLIKASAPAQIYNSARMDWPFSPCETCDDGILNQGEDRIDCGGPCPACECTSDGMCDNGEFCDGTETCDEYGQCQDGTFPCTDPAYPYCDEVEDDCDECAEALHCDDGEFCNGAEMCVDGSCQPGDDPCPDQMCDEDDDVCIAYGDCDGDGDVDLGDFLAFQSCYTGPGGGPVGPECECADFDLDTDVDLGDFLAFQSAYTGPG